MGNKAVSRNIRKARLARGLSQTQLGAKIGVTAQAVSWWEMGGDPRLSHLRKIARATKTPLAQLVGGAA